MNNNTAIKTYTYGKKQIETNNKQKQNWRMQQQRKKPRKSTKGSKQRKKTSNKTKYYEAVSLRHLVDVYISSISDLRPYHRRQHVLKDRKTNCDEDELLYKVNV